MLYYWVWWAEGTLAPLPMGFESEFKYPSNCTGYIQERVQWKQIMSMIEVWKRVKLSDSYIVTRSAQYGQSPFLEVYFAVPLKNVAEAMM